jgi:hypothetical protein
MSEHIPPQSKHTTAQVIDALKKANGILTVAAHILGCHRETVANYIKRYPTVKAAHDEATDAILDIAEHHLISAVKRGEWEQIKYYLNAKGVSRKYGVDRKEIDATIKGYDVIFGSDTDKGTEETPPDL